MTRIKKIAALALLLAFFISCDQKSEEQDLSVRDTSPKPAEVLPKPEDSVVAKLRPALLSIEMSDLQFGGNKVSGIVISDIRYTFISLKEYYEDQKRSLAGLAKLSSDKEKTQKALAYLDKMIGESTNKPDVYQVQFHLVARVAQFNYDKMQTLFLKQDLSKLNIVFPA